MLLSRPTKFGAGITLGGDYFDLNSFHDTVHTLASESGPLSEHHHTFALGLAYDLRKAKEGARDHWSKDEIYAGYSAVDVLWPIFLVQLGLLRSACAYRPANSRVQANLYALESCAAEALTEFDPAVGALCTKWLDNFSRLDDTFLLEFVTRQTKDFIFGAVQGKSRFRRLPRLLDEISPFSEAYRKFEREISERARAEGARPQDLTDQSDWPEFNW